MQVKSHRKALALLILALTGNTIRAAEQSGCACSSAPATASCSSCDSDLGCDSGCDLGCDSLCGDGLFGHSCGCEAPTLAGLLGIDECSRWKVGGFTQMGYYDDNIPLSFARNDLLSFHDIPDLFQLNQQWFNIERTAATKDGDWGIGGRIDAMYGTDAQKMQSFGNPNAGVRNIGHFDASWDHGIYGFAMPQLYGEIANDVLSIKIGHFMTPLGYEVLPSTGNFFYSHSYTMFNSEPFTHTGVLTNYKAIENLSVFGGWVLGWDSGFDQLNQANSLLSGFTYTMNEYTTFSYANTYGNFGWRDGGDNNSYSHSIVLISRLTERLATVTQSDMIRTSNPGISNFDTIGLNQYLFYDLTEKIRPGVRTEWWKADGTSFYEATGGVNVKLASNFTLRTEIRKDWAPGIGLDTDAFAIDGYVTY